MDELIEYILSNKFKHILFCASFITLGAVLYDLNQQNGIVIILEQNADFFWRGHEVRFGVINQNLIEDIFRPRLPIRNRLILPLINNNNFNQTSENNSSTFSSKWLLTKYSEVSPFQIHE